MEKLMISSQYRARLAGGALRFLLAAQVTVGAMYGLSAQAQAPEIPANIEQIPGVSQRHVPSQAATAMTVVPEDFASAKLTPGYLLELEVFNVPEMTRIIRVDQKGDLTIPPLPVPVHVNGETISEAQNTIQSALVSNEILQRPQVTLNVLQYASSNITVLGEVQLPGRLQILASRNLADVLALAGGELVSAGDEIEIRHGANDGGDVLRVHYAQGSSPDPLRSFIINPGDTVFVRRAGIVYVMGAVNRPGGYLMVNGGSLNVLQAVALAYGTTTIASVGSIRVIRPIENGKYTEIEVPYKDVAKGKSPPMQLQAQDILYIPTSGLKNILINGSGLLGSTASAAIYRVP
jgi:polysaccharide export outer membrane protein